MFIFPLQLVILQYNEVMGAFLVHLLTTNLCIWADISVGKIDKTLWYGNQKKTNDYMYNHTYGNGNESHYHYLKLINGSEMNNLTLLDNRTHLYNLVDISFYLLPTVSEYCLLAAALLYEIVMRIGQPTFIEIERPHDSKKVSFSMFNELHELITLMKYYVSFIILFNIFFEKINNLFIYKGYCFQVRV